MSCRLFFHNTSCKKRTPVKSSIFFSFARALEPLRTYKLRLRQVESFCSLPSLYLWDETGLSCVHGTRAHLALRIHVEIRGCTAHFLVFGHCPPPAQQHSAAQGGKVRTWGGTVEARVAQNKAGGQPVNGGHSAS